MGYGEEIWRLAEEIGGKVWAALEPARAEQAQADRLAASLEELRRGSEREFAAAVTAVSAGKLAPAEVPGRLVNYTAWVLDSPSSNALGASAAVARAEAGRLAKAAAPTMFAELQKVVAGVVDESVSITARLPVSAVDERSALRCGGEVSAMWFRLEGLVERWRQAVDLARAMQRAAWIDGPPDVREDRNVIGWSRFMDPRKVPAGLASLPAPLQLARAAAAGAEPCLRGWIPARVAWWRALSPDEKFATPMTTYNTFTVDALGNPMPVPS